MANLNLRSVNFQRRYSEDKYIVSTIVDTDYGLPGINMIRSPQELDTLYSTFKNKKSFSRLIELGGSILVSKLNRVGSKNPTLRLLNSDFRYCNPTHSFYDDLNPQPIDFSGYLNTSPTIDVDEVLLLNKYTYSYTIDFGTSDMEDEDHIVIPIFNTVDTTYDNSVIFSFTEFLGGIPIKHPSSFTPPIPLSTLGGSNIAIDINSFNPLNRAKLIYDWFNGVLVAAPELYIFGTIGDSNFIPELSVLDEINNKVTLVFSNPVRNIKYSKSNGVNKFSVASDYEATNRAISLSELNDSVISFESRIEGEVDIKIDLVYIKDFEFELTISLDDISEYYIVSLDEDVPIYYGKYKFIDLVLEDSLLVRSTVGLGTKIISGQYTPSMAKTLEGTYYISYGDKGTLDNEIIDGVSLSPLQSTMYQFEEEELLSNLFIFNECCNDINSVNIIYDSFLSPNTIVGISNIDIPEGPIESISDLMTTIDSQLVSENKRDLIMYVIGESPISQDLSSLVYIDTLTKSYNSLIFAEACVLGKFKLPVPKDFYSTTYYDILYNEEGINYNVFKDYINKSGINILDRGAKEQYINEIKTLDIHLNMSYMIITSYIKTSLTMYLKSRLGEHRKDLRHNLSLEISKIKKYSSLISNISIQRFEEDFNNLYITISADLIGLVGGSVDIIINITK